MKIEITNQQSIKKLNLKHIRHIVQTIAVLLNVSSGKISFVFCDNRFIQKLNRKYLKKNTATDVISFDFGGGSAGDYLGEVIVSVEQAVLAAADLGLRWQDELCLYLVHGILHLIGYDDRTDSGRQRMQRKQEELLSSLVGTRLKL